MDNVTQILSAIESGDSSASAVLLPLVYDELRKLAAARIAEEKPGQTLQSTALVHEAYLRLVGNGQPSQSWNGRGHFFAAAAEAMRRILVEEARKKRALKNGGGRKRIELDEFSIETPRNPDEWVEFDEVLSRLQSVDPNAARLVELRYFAGMTMQQAADILGTSLRTVERNWTFARTWLHRELSVQPPDAS